MEGMGVWEGDGVPLLERGVSRGGCVLHELADTSFGGTQSNTQSGSVNAAHAGRGVPWPHTTRPMHGGEGYLCVVNNKGCVLRWVTVLHPLSFVASPVGMGDDRTTH